MRPDFLVIGAMKAGTTSLHQYLRTHPGAFLPGRKEIDFFSIDTNWARGPAWYERHFASAPSGARLGEASPSYAKHPEHPRAAERIASFAPDVRLVYSVRDPVQRLLSHYEHEVARGREARPLSDALEADPRYLDTSRYGLQLDRYLEHLPADHILVVDAEELRDAREAVMSRMFRFLDLDPAWDGYADDPELYTSRERQAASRPVRFLGESRLLGPLRRRLPPDVKLRVRRAASALSSPSSGVPDRAQVDDGLRVELARALGPDQRRFRELRARCAA